MKDFELPALIMSAGGDNMYALGKSLLEPAGVYRIEVYAMEIFGYEAHIRIDLKIFSEGV